MEEWSESWRVTSDGECASAALPDTLDVEPGSEQTVGYAVSDECAARYANVSAAFGYDLSFCIMIS